MGLIFYSLIAAGLGALLPISLRSVMSITGIGFALGYALIVHPQVLLIAAGVGAIMDLHLAHRTATDTSCLNSLPGKALIRMEDKGNMVQFKCIEKQVPSSGKVTFG